MAKAQYVVLTSAHSGQQEDFERWYDECHLDDVVSVEGVYSATRYRLHQHVAGLDAPTWCSLAIYDIDAEDPEAVIARISAQAGTPEMPTSDAMNRETLVRMLATKVSEAGA